MSATKKPKLKEIINKGVKHADSNWQKAALATVAKLARTTKSFTSADVLAELEKSKEVRTHDLRAIGGIMTQARDLRMIESGGLVRRNDKHTRAATTLWRSKLFEADQKTAPAITANAPATPATTPAAVSVTATAATAANLKEAA